MTESPLRPPDFFVKQMDAVQEMVSLCPDGIIGIDRSGIVTLFNKAAEKLTGRPISDVIGRMNITEIYGSAGLARKIKKALHEEAHGGRGKLEGYEADVVDARGAVTPIRLSARLIVDNGKEIGSVGFFHDLTARKAMEARLRELSITDGLTGLFNQRYFHICLSRELTRSQRYRRPLSLACIDLDHFKRCNDELGHLEGDHVLRLVGDILQKNIRRADQAFRYGGDEFFVLLPETTLDDAAVTADKVRRHFNDRWPYDLVQGGVSVRPVTMSIGLAQAGPKETPGTLMKRADMAMYEAKGDGGDRSASAHGLCAECEE